MYSLLICHALVSSCGSTRFILFVNLVVGSVAIRFAWLPTMFYWGNRLTFQFGSDFRHMLALITGDGQFLRAWGTGAIITSHGGGTVRSAATDM